MQSLANVAGVGATQTLAQKQGIDMSNKGSFGNKVSCVAEQAVNTKMGLAKDTLTLAGGTAATVAATAGVAKSTKAQEFIKTGFNKIKDSNFGKNVKDTCSEIANNKYVKKGAEWVKKLPKPAKAVLAAGAVLTGLAVEASSNKRLIKTGQIDQKYTDKAKLEKVLG